MYCLVVMGFAMSTGKKPEWIEVKIQILRKYFSFMEY
jgi:hypothetical protein